MAGRTYASELKDRQYVKLYAKKSKTLLNAKFMHLIISSRDVKQIKIAAFEKKACFDLLTMTCLLQFVTLTAGMTLRYMTFELHKKADFDDYAMKKEIANLLNEKVDLEDLLEEQYGFIRL